jgi:hypothetical protein
MLRSTFEFVRVKTTNVKKGGKNLQGCYQNIKLFEKQKPLTTWRIRKGVIKPRDPKENGTTGGTGPLNMDAA